MKNTSRTQDLREAFAGIISMMLGLLRARGLRGLLQLPTLWLAVREIRRMAEEFVALLDAFRAGTLPPVPAPPIAPPCPPARPSARSSYPRAARARTARRCRPRTEPAPAQPARTGVFARPCPVPDPKNVSGRSASILVSARCT